VPETTKKRIASPKAISPFRPSSGEIDAVRNLLDTYNNIFLASGVDPLNYFRAWVEVQRKELSQSKRDFEELSVAGCSPQILGGLIGLLKNAPQLERAWEEAAGPRAKRQRAIRAVENAAQILEDLFPRQVAENEELVNKQIALSGHLAPTKLISELWFYSELLSFDERLAKDSNYHSISDFVKYTLVAYVKCSTGKPHDRSVSALLDEVNGPYDIEALKMWRSRKQKSIGKSFSRLPLFLRTVGIVLEEQK